MLKINHFGYFISIIIFLSVVGCAAKTEFVLRQSKEKKLNLDPDIVKSVTRYTEDLVLEPESLSLTKEGVTIYIKHLDGKELERFFSNEERFGKLAGSNPYFKDLLVFYIRIKNNSGGKIKLNPEDFVLIDDLNNQYSYLNPDYIISLYKVRSSIYSITKSTENLSPGGIYGAPVGMATSLAGQGLEKKLFQLKAIELTGGYVYDKVTYDGMIAFFKPFLNSSVIRLILPNIKTEFGVNDEPLKEIEFETSFKIFSSGN